MYDRSSVGLCFCHCWSFLKSSWSRIIGSTKATARTFVLLQTVLEKKNHNFSLGEFIVNPDIKWKNSAPISYVNVSASLLPDFLALAIKKRVSQIIGITFSCLYSSRKLDRTKSFRYNRKDRLYIVWSLGFEKILHLLVVPLGSPLPFLFLFGLLRPKPHFIPV